jgi:hypothetical protein
MNKQLAALVLVAAVVAGCGSTTSNSSVTSGGAGSPSASPSPSGSPDPLQTQRSTTSAARVLPTSAVPLLRSQKRISLPWRFLRLADGGRKVEISFGYGGCTSFGYVQVNQQPTGVEITVWGAEPISSKAICPALAAIVNGTVTLSAPLGSRQLLHGLVSFTNGFPPQ